MHTNFILVFFFLISFIAIVLVVAVAFFYNKFVGYRNKVREAWSGIDIQLRKRNNLIPGLMANLQSLMAHEKSIFDNISKFRIMSIDADNVKDQTKAEEHLGNELSKLIAISVKYPEVKSNRNFIDFQEAMEEVEGDIENARRYYNALVRDNNNAVEKFPGFMIANIFGFTIYDFFENEKF